MTTNATPPVVLFYGDEPLLLRAHVLAVREAVVDPAMAAFNHERFEGRALESVGVVLDACAQLPMLARQRLVELTDPDQIGKGKDKNQDALGALVDYVANPNPSTVLLLTGSSMDGRSRLVTAVKKVGKVVKLEPLKREADAVAWLESEAKLRGIAVQRGALEAITREVGTGPSDLLGALELASIHAEAGQPVTVADVHAVVPRTRETVVFDLTDAVGMRDRARAMALLARIFAERAMPEVGQANMLLALMVRQLRMLLLLQCNGAQALGNMPPFLLRKLTAQARQFDVPRIKHAYAALARLDRDLKGGSAAVVRDPRGALQRWILEVCGSFEGVAPRT